MELMQTFFQLGSWGKGWLRECRSSTAIFCLFASLVLYGIRPRGSISQTLFILENLFFVSSVVLFPWSRLQMQQIFFFIAALFLHAALIAAFYYNTKEDWLISFVTCIAFVKCVVVARLLSAIEVEKVYKGLLFSLTLILMSQVVWYLLFGLDIRHGFSAQIGDRNYFSLLNVLMLASVLIPQKKMGLGSPFECYLGYLFLVITFFLCVLSGSRTGFLAISILIWILFSWRGLVIWLCLLLSAYLFDFTRVFEYRYINQFSAPPASSEAGRFAMILAALETYSIHPWGLVTGFGLMATSHLDWMMMAYKKMGSGQPIQIQHNSILDFIFSFGIFGLIFLLNFFKKIGDASILIFLGVATIFNNVLIFLPLYVFLGVYFSVKNVEGVR